MGGCMALSIIKRKTRGSRGALLVHGFSGNRFGLGVLAQRLATCGYFCLSIDLPSHYLHLSKFTMGELSETITDAILLMGGRFGSRSITIIGHSMGAVGTLFSHAGYNLSIEKSLYSIWEQLCALIEKQAVFIRKNDKDKVVQVQDQIDLLYGALKKQVLTALQKGVQVYSLVGSLVLLAPPVNCKSAIPGLSILSWFGHKWLKRTLEMFLHKPAVAQIYKEGNSIGYVPENKDEYFYWQFFKTRGSVEFLDYFLHMKEPIDYLTLVEQLAKFRRKDQGAGFFEYYHTKYLLSKPKLFIYGMRDLYLKPFLPFAKSRLEKFYQSCGNAEIHHGGFSHVMLNNPKQQFATVVLKNDRVPELILEFLNRSPLLQPRSSTIL